MKRGIILFNILTYISVSALAQQNISDKFLFRSHSYNGKTIPYRLFIPENYNPSHQYPLMLCLHGSGERGSDNFRQITTNKLATSWADSINQLSNPCFVVAPQCPLDEEWTDDISIEHSIVSANTLTVLNIIDSLEQEFNIDINRIYITGLSMGGFGTWDIITRYPDKFAAAIPICGGGDTATISRIEHIPLWDFHGRVDPVVPVEFSRMMISALEKLGRQPVHTHCNKTNCVILSDTTIQRYINEGADILYTEYELGGHVIWDQAFDTPELHDWVFKQHRIPGGASITNFSYHKSVEGMHIITWNSLFSGGSIDISYSADNGKTWEKLIERYPNTGSFLWDSKNSEDSFWGLIKILFRDSSGFLCGYSTSGNFLVNNTGNGRPYIKILNEELNKGAIITSPDYLLNFLAGDPEDDSIKIELYYSPDGGNTNIWLDSFNAPTDTLPQYKIVNLYSIQNSNNALLYAVTTDGINSYTDSVFYFQKNNEREPVPSSYIQPISKYYDVPLILNFVDGSASEEKEYMLTFNDTSSTTQKYFSVLDINSGQYVVEQSEFYPNNESKIFNGFSFITNDVYTKLDLTRSKWNDSVSKILNFSSTPFFFNTNYPTYNGYGKPNDYKVVFYGMMVDTSVADTLFPITPSNIISAKPIDFKVFNTTTNNELDVSFLKVGTISSTYSIWWKEYIGSNLKRIWKINIVDNAPNRIIPMGDTLFLFTYKGLSIYDSLKIVTPLTSIKSSIEENNLKQYKLYQNYPNPFNPFTKISWQSPVGSWHTLKVYDVLGREVATLVNEEKPAGRFEIQFDASQLSSGVYFYKFQVGSFVGTKKMILLR